MDNTDFIRVRHMTDDLPPLEAQLRKIIETQNQFATFPVVEKVKLLRLVLFSFLSGNEDMHLKNFSLISRQGKRELSPAYDLVNTTLVMERAEEELALSLDGKKRNLTRRLLVEYFGRNRLRDPEAVNEEVLQDVVGPATNCIDSSEFNDCGLNQKVRGSDILN